MIFEKNNRIKLIFIIYQILGWPDLQLEKDLPSYDSLNDKIKDIYEPDTPEDDSLETIIRIFRIPQVIIDGNIKKKATIKMIAIITYIKKIKKKVIDGTKDIPNLDIDPNDQNIRLNST